ncbi:hypothetical protein J421_4663 (plasmid) [Gemmatirosa kalamazoonensis]|uniref:Putative DnaT-like domain-containing protein n=1 Tax=Gemmatirosa kalamazoonensis TaxID=861299 RepID=W0RP40_9BACT|nr:DnaT-like ssDNA-binding protein [Gemmatirosa kalamazoonensis]AHG92130.1 hypothetical protein J421_4595 [Gemmatirosa kalamazoonensis]AHG92198.1 hypothetical protein J421_4663 [Gemmatirosa kalamazoonensis]
MTLALDPTVGGAAANTFVARATFDSYVERRVGSTGVGGSVPTDDDVAITRALVAATDRLTQESWIGVPATLTQALPWPRVYRLGELLVAPLYPADAQQTFSVPRGVQEATCELACCLLEGSWAPAADAALVPNATVDMDGLRVALVNNPHALPPTVVRQLRGLRRPAAACQRVIRA